MVPQVSIEEMNLNQSTHLSVTVRPSWRQDSCYTAKGIDRDSVHDQVCAYTKGCFGVLLSCDDRGAQSDAKPFNMANGGGALMGWRGVHGHSDAWSSEEGAVVWCELSGTCHSSAVGGPALEQERHLCSVTETHRVQRRTKAHQAAPLQHAAQLLQQTRLWVSSSRKVYTPSKLLTGTLPRVEWLLPD